MNKQFYVNNTIVGKFLYFNTLQGLVRYLGEVLVPLAYKQTREQYVQYLAELGHGYDDGSGVVITRALAESFNIGVVKEDGHHVRTDVHTVDKFQNSDYGD